MKTRFQASRPVAVVTGASAGIGLETAKRLVTLGWQVIGTGRDPGRCEAAEAQISRAAGTDGAVAFVRADFTNMSAVRQAAREIGESTSRLDILINNAGGVRDGLYVTEEATEATFAANHLAPFLLTRELLPLLRTTAASAPAGTVRVIAVSSSGHRSTEGIDWDDLQAFRSPSAAEAYCRVKLANILFTRALARRVAPEGIVAQAMHPGRVDSNFASHGDGAMQSYMAAAPKVGPDEPARTLVWLATAPEVGVGPGRFFHAMAEEVPSERALSDEDAERLWTESEQLLARLGQ